MEKDKIFCENCREDVEYETSEKILETPVKGKIYKYNGKVVRCKKCGKELYSPDIVDGNLDSLYGKINHS